MALRFKDGFDYYALADASKVWTTAAGNAPSIGASGARSGSQGFVANVGAYVEKILDNQATWIVGTAFQCSTLPTSAQSVIALLDTGSAQVSLQLDMLGRLSVVSASTLGTSATVINTGIWYYIEFKATINNTTGSYEVRVQGASVLSNTGVDTQQTANAYANTVRLNGPATVSYFDDVTICDTTGSAPNNNFLGDVRVQAILPNGAGATTAWTPSAGSNYQCVDDTAPNGDTDYVSSSTVNQVDTYAYGNLTPTTGTVYGVSVHPYTRKDDAGVRSIAPVVRHSGTDYVGTTQALSTSYQYLGQIYETNPGTSAAWTISDVNNAEFGQKLIA